MRDETMMCFLVCFLSLVSLQLSYSLFPLSIPRAVPAGGALLSPLLMMNRRFLLLLLLYLCVYGCTDIVGWGVLLLLLLLLLLLGLGRGCGVCASVV